MRGLHWFRNDLRLLDNSALLALGDRVDEWLPVFVLDPALLARNALALPRTRFLLDCVATLSRDLAERGIALQILEGRPEIRLAELARETRAGVVSWNAAPTPLGARRDAAVETALARLGVESIVLRDHVVFGADEIRTKTGGCYAVYGPYRKVWWDAWHRAPRLAARRIRLPAKPIRKAIPGEAPRLPMAPPTASGVDAAPADLPPGGEVAARRRLARFLDDAVERYATDRDRPDVDGTSRLSPYLRFGAISIRRCVGDALEAAAQMPRAKEGALKWIDELVWRDFYHAVLQNSPRVLTQSFRPEYDALEWSDDEAAFLAWKAGRTGYPFVDAGMRQLRATGWMHNRVRMVVASFLTKDLLVDWRRGERYFFEALVDGDPASNNGGWQWAASTGTDAQPYFRIFNPVAQGQRFDPEGKYVKTWVPELRALPAARIHAPWIKGEPPSGYPRPIVDHGEARLRALAAYRAARRSSSSARTRSER